MLNITYVITEDPETPGAFLVDVPSFPGCHTFGYSLKEAHARAHEAIRAYIEMLTEEGEPIPHEIESAVLHL